MKLYIIQYLEPSFKRATQIWTSLDQHAYSHRFLTCECFPMLINERTTFENMELLGLTKSIEPSKVFHIVKP